ncbi:A24 family peptidase [Methylobacterium sp. J-043]|nr:A24 family peptidase [Methylobacterium sp. J-043]
MVDPLLLALLPLGITIPIALIDIRHGIIPNTLNACLFALGLGFVAMDGTGEPLMAMAHALVAGCVAFALLYGFREAYAYARGRTGLGLGDVKFIAAATPLVGLSGLPTMMLLASLTGLSAIGCATLLGFPITRTTRLPFGPFLVIGLHTTTMFQVIPS